VERSIALNGNQETWKNKKNYPMFTKTEGNPYEGTWENSHHPVGDHISVRWRNDEVDESPYLLDFAAEVDSLEAK
jgi:hypothetical protein